MFNKQIIKIYYHSSNNSGVTELISSDASFFRLEFRFFGNVLEWVVISKQGLTFNKVLIQIFLGKNIKINDTPAQAFDSPSVRDQNVYSVPNHVSPEWDWAKYFCLLPAIKIIEIRVLINFNKSIQKCGNLPLFI